MANELASQGNILFYSNENEKEFVQVIFKDDNFWLTQKSMSELFGCTTDNISLHLKNIFNEEELDKNSVTEKFSVTASDGKNYNTQCYNLDAIISVGYRANSKKAQFRTNRLWKKLMPNTKFLTRDKKLNLILIKK